VRKRATGGKVESRKSYREIDDEIRGGKMIAMAKRVRRKMPKRSRYSLRTIADELVRAGYQSESGKPACNPERTSAAIAYGTENAALLDPAFFRRAGCRCCTQITPTVNCVDFPAFASSGSGRLFLAPLTSQGFWILRFG
jgi:hypothetical protein